MIKFIKNILGLCIHNYKIIEKIRKSGFYYTNITGNIYKNIYEYKERIMKL